MEHIQYHSNKKIVVQNLFYFVDLAFSLCYLEHAGLKAVVLLLLQLPDYVLHIRFYLESYTPTRETKHGNPVWTPNLYLVNNILI